MAHLSSRKTGSERFLSFYFFLMYLFTCRPSLWITMNEATNMPFLLLGYGMTFFAAIYYRVNFSNKKLFYVLGIVVLWTIAQWFIHPTFFRLSPFIILEIFTAYIIIKLYKSDFTTRFENITYILCIIALIGWVLQLIASPIMVFLADKVGIYADKDSSRSLIIYTVNLTGSLRNCGFSWEPGRMACMICVALLFYLLRTKCKFRNKRFWVMTICLLTTMSTTGYCTVVVVIMSVYMSLRKSNKGMVPFFIVIAAAIINLPFVGDKIESLSEGASEHGIQRISAALNYEANNNNGDDRGFYVPQRFEGLMLNSINLQHTNFFIGDGRDFTQFYINRVKKWRVKTSEGIIEPAVQYGLVIVLLMYYLLYLTSKNISISYSDKNKWLFFITFVMINISYNFWETPLFMALWMMPIYNKMIWKNHSSQSLQSVTIAKKLSAVQ